MNPTEDVRKRMSRTVPVLKVKSWPSRTSRWRAVRQEGKDAPDTSTPSRDSHIQQRNSWGHTTTQNRQGLLSDARSLPEVLSVRNTEYLVGCQRVRVPVSLLLVPLLAHSLLKQRTAVLHPTQQLWDRCMGMTFEGTFNKGFIRSFGTLH